MRLAAYAGVSAALAAGTLVKAFSQRPNFYSATVYLSQSNACILILTNLALVMTVSFIYAMQRLCYGRLRPIEIEQLSEKAWYAVLDTLLAMPSLRDDVGGWLLVVFVLLLAAKVWAWIAEGRIDILEQQPPQNPRMFHIRLSASLVISIVFDMVLCKYCLESVWDNPRRPGMMIIFAFEFAIQTVFSLFTASRYLLALHEARVVASQTVQKRQELKTELRQERLQALRTAGQDESTLVEPTDDDVDDNEIDVPGWEEKRRYLFGLELATDLFKLTLYTLFFAISLTFIGLPMHIMRDVYITVASFSKRIQDYSNYRRATRDMNSRYPDATAEELSRENTCIVCRDVMIPWEQPIGQQPSSRINEGLRAKKLPCGHILHLRCLKAWLERQQTCPTCRRSVLPQATESVPGRGPLLPHMPVPGIDVPGQPQQPAGQAQAQAQPPAQQPRPRQDRMRWLNMGPVRLGFYNGPAGDVQEALRQRQAAQAIAAARPDGTHRSRSSQRSDRHLSVDDHLRSVEVRLLQQAHNLEVDRAHLAHVRALEAEIARLRTLRISSSRNNVSNTAVPGATNADGTRPAPAALAAGPSAVPYVRYQADPAAQPLANGNSALPAGLILPEGWTLTPLQRNGGGYAQEPPNPFAQFISSPSVLGPGQAGWSAGVASGQLMPTAGQASASSTSTPALTSSGVTSSSGPATEARPTSAPTPTLPTEGSQTEQAPSSNAAETSATQSSTSAPPTWGFTDIPSHASSQQPGSSTGGGQHGSGDRQAQAASVEEVPDSGDG